MCVHACGYVLVYVCMCVCALMSVGRRVGGGGEWLWSGGVAGQWGGGVAAEAAGRTPASLLAPGAPLLSK